MAGKAASTDNRLPLDDVLIYLAKHELRTAHGGFELSAVSDCLEVARLLFLAMPADDALAVLAPWPTEGPMQECLSPGSFILHSCFVVARPLTHAQ